MSTVLIVDDEVMNRKVASKTLHKEGFDIIEAVDGLDAIKKLNSNNVDIILMDLMMPNMNGFEATKIIKIDDKLSHIPLIIVSALSDQTSIDKCLKLGANEYITKPLNLVEFVHKIKETLNGV